VKVIVEDRKGSCTVQEVLLARQLYGGANEGGFSSQYPYVLRCPEKLCALKAFLAKKYCALPCFYVGGCDCQELFVLIGERFSRIQVPSPSAICWPQFDVAMVELCPVRKHERHHLVKKGLAKIDLQGIEPTV